MWPPVALPNYELLFVWLTFALRLLLVPWPPPPIPWLEFDLADLTFIDC